MVSTFTLYKIKRVHIRKPPPSKGYLNLCCQVVANKNPSILLSGRNWPSTKRCCQTRCYKLRTPSRHEKTRLRSPDPRPRPVEAASLRHLPGQKALVHALVQVGLLFEIGLRQAKCGTTHFLAGIRTPFFCLVSGQQRGPPKSKKYTKQDRANEPECASLCASPRKYIERTFFGISQWGPQSSQLPKLCFSACKTVLRSTCCYKVTIFNLELHTCASRARLVLQSCDSPARAGKLYFAH